MNNNRSSYDICQEVMCPENRYTNRDSCAKVKRKRHLDVK